ncbi:MAG: hypothetical protein ABI612_20055 [Betaproteobacteria bacterium]
MRRTRSIAAALLAIIAIAYLICMAVVGALPRQKQLVKFEAKGVMQLPPERITGVAIQSGSGSAIFTRTLDGGWSREGGESLDPALAKRLSMAVQFMNTSGPVRVLAPEEYQGTDLHEFGLDKPQFSIALFEGPRPIIAAHFGGRNPDNYLQYVSVDGRRELFLLSRFVGEEWKAVVQGGLRQ